MTQIEVLYNLFEKAVDIQEILLGHQTIHDALSLPVYEFCYFGKQAILACSWEKEKKESTNSKLLLKMSMQSSCFHGKRKATLSEY